jgi:hypothetical protein
VRLPVTCIAVVFAVSCTSTDVNTAQSSRDAAVDGAVAVTGAGGKPPPTPDAGHSVVCQEAQGYRGDITLEVVRDENASLSPGPPDYDFYYAGPVDAADTQLGLELRFASTTFHALLAGKVPLLPGGSTLWASFSQQWTQTNTPIVASYANSLRTSEHGPILAATLLASAHPSPLAFLGIQVTPSLRCQSQGQCPERRSYSVTLHGDRDLTLEPGANGRVAIDGIEYVVWLERASAEDYDAGAPPCRPGTDYAPPAGLSLQARVVDYAALLPLIDHDDLDAGPSFESDE